MASQYIRPRRIHRTAQASKALATQAPLWIHTVVVGVPRQRVRQNHYVRREDLIGLEETVFREDHLNAVGGPYALGRRL